MKNLQMISDLMVKALPKIRKKTGIYLHPWSSQVAQMVNNPLANIGDIRDVGLNPESGRSTRGAHGSPVQYSCLENSMERRAWRATVHSIAKSRAQLK